VFPENQFREPEQLLCCVEADLRKTTYNGGDSVSDLAFWDRLVKLVDTLFKNFLAKLPFYPL